MYNSCIYYQNYNNSNFTAGANTTHFVDTSNGRITITLPATTVNLNTTTIKLVDVASSWHKNSITITSPTGNMINNLSSLEVSKPCVLDLILFNGKWWCTNHQNLMNFFGDSTSTTDLLPNFRFDNYNFNLIRDYLRDIQSRDNDNFNVVSYRHGHTATITQAFAYSGMTFVPSLRRIYLIPHRQSTSATWHYIDCNTGNFIAYSHGITLTELADYAYIGGVYFPPMNRLYFMPWQQAGSAKWHYIDCSNGNVVSYNNPTGMASYAFYNGCYDPVSNRVYLGPHKNNGAQWWYIDSTGNFFGYNHNTGINNFDGFYRGMQYLPDLKRIYFVPHNRSLTAQTHHYIDCNDGQVKTYNSGGVNAYLGAAYSPTEGRLYLVNFDDAAGGTNSSWRWIETRSTSIFGTGFIGTGWPNGLQQYWGGIYSPVSNRIYLSPYGGANARASFNFIDCNNVTDANKMRSYTHGVTDTIDHQAFWSGVFCPIQNRVYFGPASQSQRSNWLYIQEHSNERVNTMLMGNSAIFGNGM